MKSVSVATKLQEQTSYGSVGVHGDDNLTDTKQASKFARRGLVCAVILILVVSCVAGGAVYYKKLKMDPLNFIETPVPGTDKMARGYNLFDGRFFAVENAHYIGDFSFPSSSSPSNTVRLGSQNYLIANALTVTSDYSCEKRGETFQSVYTSSVGDMNAQMSSKSWKFDQEATVSASVPVGPGEVGAETSYTTSLLFGSTDTMAEGNEFASSNFNYRSNIEYQARTFDAKVRWDSSEFRFTADFITAFNAVQSYSSSSDRLRKVLRFFATYGSHVMERAIFGAYCSKSVFYEAGSTQSSYSRVEQTINNNKVEIFNVEFGSDSSSSSTTKTDTTTGVTYTQNSERCQGIVENNGCNHQQTVVSLQPTLMNVLPKPIWTLPLSELSAKAKQAFEEAVKDLIRKTYDCSKERCNQKGGSGTCVLKPSFWSKVTSSTWDGVVSNSDFESNCVCKTGSGPNCTPTTLLDTTIYTYTSNSQYCGDVCSSHKKSPIRTGTYTGSSYDYLFCSANDNHNGYRGGYNLERSTERNKCAVPAQNQEIRHSSFQCYCAESDAIVFVDSSGGNCKELCSSKGLAAIETGTYAQNGGKFYACAGEYKGLRGGYNLKEIRSGICSIPVSEERHLTGFKCICSKL